jgi:hypothetical protein
MISGISLLGVKVSIPSIIVVVELHFSIFYPFFSVPPECTFYLLPRMSKDFWTPTGRFHLLPFFIFREICFFFNIQLEKNCIKQNNYILIV